MKKNKQSNFQNLIRAKQNIRTPPYSFTHSLILLSFFHPLLGQKIRWGAGIRGYLHGGYQMQSTEGRLGLELGLVRVRIRVRIRVSDPRWIASSAHLFTHAPEPMFLLVCTHTRDIASDCYKPQQSQINASFLNYLAKFTLAFCPPLSETPRSPTNVSSPFAKFFISLMEKADDILIKNVLQNFSNGQYIDLIHKV